MTDDVKRSGLIRCIIAQPEYVEGRALVKPNEFFEGNCDLGSIGCNLSPHPGLDGFRRALNQIAELPPVDAIWLQILDIDEGDWPFCENVMVFGSVTITDVAPVALQLSPSEIDEMRMDWTPSRDAGLQGQRYVNLWWD